MISLPPQVKKVQDFYNEKTDEISQRLEVLVESVDTSGLKPKEHKRRKSMVKTFTSKFEEILQGSGKRRYTEFHRGITEIHREKKEISPVFSLCVFVSLCVPVFFLDKFLPCFIIIIHQFYK